MLAIYVINYSHVIPISLYVTLEMVKIALAQLIFYDKEMYDSYADKPAKAKTSELIEELGQVDFIFSDKTGTLTQNVMEFRKCAVADKVYGGSPVQEPGEYHINRDNIAYNLIIGPNSSSDTNFEKNSLLNFFRMMSICHSAMPERDFFGKLSYSSSSPDEVALLNGAREMGFIYENKTTDTIDVRNIYTSK